MTVAGKRVGAATGFNQDVRPDDASLDVDRGDLVDTDADLVFAKPRTLAAYDRPVRHHNDRRENMVPASPAACAKDFRIHAVTLIQEAGLSNWI